MRIFQPWLIETYNTHCVAASSSGVAPGILGAVGDAIGDSTIPMRCITGLGDVDSGCTIVFSVGPLSGYSIIWIFIFRV